MGRTYNPQNKDTNAAADGKRILTGSVKLIKGPNDITKITVGNTNLTVRKLTSGGTAPSLHQRSGAASVDIDAVDLNDRDVKAAKTRQAD